MSQHSRFEEVFHDSPQPVSSYEEGYPGPQPEIASAYEPAKVVLMPDGQHRSSSGSGGRLVLALVSLGMVFAMGLVVVMTTPSVKMGFFTLVFAGTAVLINLSFNRRR